MRSTISNETPIPTPNPPQPHRPVLARLHGLFPGGSGSVPSTDCARQRSTSKSLPAPPQPRLLKVRIMTWNMHDSLPKGDIEELLGKVPSYNSLASALSDSPTFPVLPPGMDHPYHIVVVAGQECPSISGLPMGIGAGFKLRDKDEEKEVPEIRRGSRHKHKDKDTISDPSKYKKGTEENEHTSGWSWMLEDWFCHGGVATSKATAFDVSEISLPKPLLPHSISAPKEPVTHKGPYRLLTKERLMGIYLAVFIHRDLDPFIRGTSKSAVTAGLIGGRVGNKGGVGISINVDGISLLFMNCHLAAHEDKVHHRLANLQKIKSELQVDDFLPADDPRKVSEDLTDRFDHTFLFGDLNFRLDISRLHADWLISRQEYTQALAFDQLKNLMRNGQAFVNFNEGPIDFPPTFKYDVLRTIKRPRGGSKSKSQTQLERIIRVTEVEEQPVSGQTEDKDRDSDDDNDMEGASLASSVETSLRSRYNGNEADGDDYFHAILSANGTPGAILSAAANKAKTKWKDMLSPTSPSSPTQWFRKRHSHQTDGTSQKKHRSALSLQLSGLNGSNIDGKLGISKLSTVSLETPDLSSRRNLASSGSVKSTARSEDDSGAPADDRGVYDSSSKRRVPSWCDRILWKSTVQIEPEPEDHPTKPKQRMVQFFANAFRPLSMTRARRASQASPIPSTQASSIDQEAALVEEGQTVTAPFSRFAVVVDSPIPDEPSHVRSSDDLTISPKAPFSRAPATDPDIRLRRSISDHPSMVNSQLKPRRALTTLPPITSPESPSVDSPTSTASGSPLAQHRRMSLPMWRFLPSFLSYSSPSAHSQPVSIIDPPPPIPRRGEVVCLMYDTLDDKGMRRLEGRSDHRPVIGAYGIYI